LFESEGTPVSSGSVWLYTKNILMMGIFQEYLSVCDRKGLAVVAGRNELGNVDRLAMAKSEKKVRSVVLRMRGAGGC